MPRTRLAPGRVCVHVASLAFLAVAFTAPVAAELQIERLEATHKNGSEYEFPVVSGDSLAASRINTFLQVSELEKLPGRYRKAAFEEIWPEGDSWHGTTGIGYEVETHEPGFLSLAIHRSYMGAYPSNSWGIYNFDARTGEVITLETVLSAEGLAQVRRQAAERRLKRLDDFLAGKPVDAGSTQLRSDPEAAEDQKALYLECRDAIRDDDLTHDILTLGEASLILRRESCGPHVVQAIDDLGDFRIELPYTELRERWNDYGRCLLAEKRTDCQRRVGRVAPGVYRGQIGGRYPITLVFVRPPFSRIFSGAAYFYDKRGIPISLGITVTEPGSVQLDERGSPPARFDLRRVDGALRGHWTQEGKAPLEVELN